MKLRLKIIFHALTKKSIFLMSFKNNRIDSDIIILNYDTNMARKCISFIQKECDNASDQADAIRQVQEIINKKD